MISQPINCPVCHGLAIPMRHKNECWINICSQCGVEFVWPMPSAESLKAFYNRYEDIRARPDVVRINSDRCLTRLMEHCGLESSDHILDYGCGNNIFSHVCRERGIASAYGYDRYGPGDPQDLCCLSDLPDGQWNWITVWGVLEHLMDPGELFAWAKKHLVVGGAIAGTTVYTEGTIPYQHKPLEHLFYFTKRSLTHLAAQSGFRIEILEEYTMTQASEVYFSIITRTVPDRYKPSLMHQLPDYVTVPTNELFFVLRVV